MTYTVVGGGCSINKSHFFFSPLDNNGDQQFDLLVAEALGKGGLRSTMPESGELCAMIFGISTTRVSSAEVLDTAALLRARQGTLDSEKALVVYGWETSTVEAMSLPSQTVPTTNGGLITVDILKMQVWFASVLVSGTWFHHCWYTVDRNQPLWFFFILLTSIAKQVQAIPHPPILNLKALFNNVSSLKIWAELPYVLSVSLIRCKNEALKMTVKWWFWIIDILIVTASIKTFVFWLFMFIRTSSYNTEIKVKQFSNQASTMQSWPSIML